MSRKRWELLSTVCALPETFKLREASKFLGEKYLKHVSAPISVYFHTNTFCGPSRERQLKCENSCQWAFNRLIMHRAFTCWKYINNSSIIRIDDFALRSRWFIGDAFYNAYAIFVVTSSCKSFMRVVLNIYHHTKRTVSWNNKFICFAGKQ